jgi:peptidoglycan/xylan/chitin deacetylase (PgdA/CDA1 family)
MSKKELRQWKANLGTGSAYWRQFAKFLTQRWRSRGKHDPLWHFENWLDLEAQYGFRSTFYFFSNPVQRAHHHDCGYQLDDQFMFRGERVTVAEFARELLRGGWDVGLHGSYNSATDADLLREQKDRLEKTIDFDVLSSRQHYLRYDAARTPKIHAEVGFQTDSTQGFNRNIGFRAGSCFPYHCISLDSSEQLPVLEIPQHIMDGALFACNSLEYDCDLAVAHSLMLMDRVQELGGVLTISWHPNNIEEVNPVYWRCFAEILREAYQRNAWGCSARQLADWWTSRRTPSAVSA